MCLLRCDLDRLELRVCVVVWLLRPLRRCEEIAGSCALGREGDGEDDIGVGAAGMRCLKMLRRSCGSNGRPSGVEFLWKAALCLVLN